jgi:hypothetical protein
VYADAPRKSITPAEESLTEIKVVIAHQKPTPMLYNADSLVVFGPPQTMGKKLFVNTNPAKKYFGTCKSPDGSGSAVYLYPESSLQDAHAKKAAKYLKAVRSLKLIDQTSESLMRSPNQGDQQYGLAMWLNNNSKLRIGAHADAASVDVIDRKRILNQARAENWSDTAKYAALDELKKPTFGLLTSQAGHIKLDPQKKTAQWFFRGKGGKLITGDNVTVALPDLQYHTLSRLMHMKALEDRVFPDVKYKEVWKYFKTYGITPHVARGAFADQEVNELIMQFKPHPGASAQTAFAEFKKAVREKVSDKLAHSADMTLKSYVTDTTSRAIDEAFNRTREYIYEAAVVDNSEALAEVITWMEVGPGNVVV